MKELCSDLKRPLTKCQIKTNKSETEFTVTSVSITESSKSDSELESFDNKGLKRKSLLIVKQVI